MSDAQFEGPIFFSAAGIDNCSAVNELKLRSRNLKRRPIRSDQR